MKTLKIVIIVAFSFSNSYAQVGINTTSPTSMLDVNGQITIDQKNFGGYGGLLIKGDAPGSNYPNLAFSTLNSLGNDEIASYIGANINSNTAGFESMDLSFLTSTNGLAGLSEKMRIKANGNIGLGTTSPNAILQFANTISNRKMVLWESVNNEHQYYGFGINGGTLRYQVDDNAANHIFYSGINTFSSRELMSIKGNGDVRINNLAAYENKPVSVTANGTLKIDNLVRYYCLNNFDFKDEGATSNSTFISGDSNLFSTFETGTLNSKKMAATVHIPDGTTIVSITGYAYDNSALGNITFSIYKIPNTGSLQGILNNVITTSGALATIQSVTNTAILETVNNQTGNYVVFASFTGPTWDSTNSKVKSFVIGYKFN